MTRAILGLIPAILIISGCTANLRPRKLPELFSNSKFQSTAAAEREADVQSCIQLADRNIELPDEGWIIARSALIGSLIGTAPGAVTGAITGEVGEDIAVGAIIGATIGIIQGFVKITEDVPAYQRFVENCLHKKDYEILGWEEVEEEEPPHR